MGTGSAVWLWSAAARESSVFSAPSVSQLHLEAGEAGDSHGVDEIVLDQLVWWWFMLDQAWSPWFTMCLGHFEWFVWLLFGYFVCVRVCFGCVHFLPFRIWSIFWRSRSDTCKTSDIFTARAAYSRSSVMIRNIWEGSQWYIVARRSKAIGMSLYLMTIPCLCQENYTNGTMHKPIYTNI